MTIWSTNKHFKNAKACFAENLSLLPQRSPLSPLKGSEALLWNLSRGLHDLTVALENDLDDIHARMAALEKALQRDK